VTLSAGARASSSAQRAPSGPRVWLLAARPATLPAAVVPVIVATGAALHGTHTLNLPILIPTLVAALLIQVGTNFANDVFDFRRGADTPDRLGPPAGEHQQRGALKMGDQEQQEILVPETRQCAVLDMREELVC